jgi:alpha-mannosidase
VRATVEVEIDARNGHRIQTEGRTAVPSQLVHSHAVTTTRARIAFRADVPPMGWTTVRMFPGLPRHRPAMAAGDLHMENGRLRFDLDPGTGLATLRRSGSEAPSVLNGAAGVVLSDESDTWSHGVTRYDCEIGRFALRSIRLVEHGPVLSTIRVESGWGDSRLVQRFTLAADADYVLVEANVDWRDHRRALKLAFPTGLENAVATYSVPYGHVVRPADGEEEPAQQWIDVTGDTPAGYRAGLSILNDGKYSFSVDGGTASITVLRSPAYAHHDPAELDANDDLAWMDQGQQSFRYALLPHGGEWRTAHTVRRAAELNRPVTALLVAAQLGSLPPEAFCGTCDKPGVAISALKRAEDGNGLIVRAWETAGRRTTARLLFRRWERDIEATFGPFEIRSYLLPDDPACPVREVNLLEDPLERDMG